MPTQTFFNLPEDKKEKICEAALEEFASQPYNAASVNKIVDKAEISKGSLYQYFNDKKDLYLYLIELAGQEKLKFLQQREQVVFDDFYEGLTSLIIIGAEFDLANPLHSKVLMSALNGPLADESLAKMKEMSKQYLVHFVKQAQDKNEIRTDVPTDLIVFYINALTTEFAKYVAAKVGLDYFAQLYEPENLAKVRQIDWTEAIRGLMKLVKGGLLP